ncbi:transporter substrate-binding domain-containing protein [Sanguibacter hominis ATCC BAA-789]|uniref:Transporter substrate-binding domain-containing protein n=1 Tax=Sanguibacter hominis ATCC BAA-789 TaxID=1312740 RepID=A0A9X5FEG6_9MICO|nr:transporter substrate-binding domain-containing protein [Sanguibacter hominis]NKX92446.1 transporter substrate-binding domain-containing protein [Sanguibacter hominis ATCC BAA-789]
MNIRRSVAATAVVLSALALAACSSDGDEKTAADPVAALKESGVLKVGTEGTYAPFTFHDPTSGELTGYDVEVITAVAEKLGVKPEFSETKWDSIFAGLEAKRYDVVANEVTINDERAAKYDLSDPYSVSVPVVIVPADDTELTDLAGFEGRTAAQTATSNWGALARDNGAKVEPIDGFTEAVTAVRDGRVDFTVNDNLAALEYLTSTGDTSVKIAFEIPEEKVVQAFALRKDSGLVAEINKALGELAADGTLASIGEKYFGTDISK